MKFPSPQKKSKIRSSFDGFKRLIALLTVDESNVAVLDMTLTSAACPLQDVIEDQTRSVLQDLVSDVRINWVWMPPWGPNKITDDGREQLRAIGFTV